MDSFTPELRSVPKPKSVSTAENNSFNNLGPKINLASSDAATTITVFISEMNRLMSSLSHDSLVSTVDSENSWQKLSANEKQFILDVYCWNKDEFSVNRFYQLLPYILDSIKGNAQATISFFNSYEFHLYLKSQYNFYNFDQEEQNYPDDDNYFVTKDFSFVFHYQIGEKSSDLIENILDEVLQVVGSEYFISKLQISSADGYQLLQEEAYNAKNSRLATSGYPSYEEALEWQAKLTLSTGDSSSNLTNSKAIEIQNKLIPGYSLLKTLQAVFEFKKSNSEFDLLDSEKILKQSLEEVLFYVKIGKSQKNSDDYKTLYRLGRTFLHQGKKKSEDFRSYMLQQQFSWSFIGDILGDICEDYSTEAIITNAVNAKKYSLSSIESINNSIEIMNLFIKHASIIDYYWSIFKKISNEGAYLNYSNNDVNFEALLITDMINYFNNQKLSIKAEEYSLKINDLIKFYGEWNEVSSTVKREILYSFIEKFNLTIPSGEIFIKYIINLIGSEIESLDIANMQTEDFRFVGGALLVQ